MVEPGTLRDGRRIGYGFGFFLSQLDGRPEISHGGGIVGFSGYLGSLPADGLAVVTLTNSDSARLYDGYLARELARTVSDRQPDAAESVAGGYSRAGSGHRYLSDWVGDDHRAAPRRPSGTRW
jgi:hypothetical protein